VALQVDHIQPISKDGNDDILNYITSCSECNAGKGNRELSDETVLAKRKTQLDELQERREQLEMLFEWQRGLEDLEGQALYKVVEFWNDLTVPFSLTDNGISILRKTLKKYGVKEILESMRICIDQYVENNQNGDPTHESILKAFGYIERVCANRRRFEQKPYLKDLYYIRGIMRNRFTYLNEWKALSLMEKALKAGMDIDEIKSTAIDCRSWSHWRETIETFLEE
jgi:hypothetical protein